MFRSQWLWFPLYVFCLVHGCHSVVLHLDTINMTFIDVCSLAFSFQWCKRKLCKRKVYSVQSKRVKKIIKEQYKKLGKIRYAKFRHAACKKSKFNVTEDGFTSFCSNNSWCMAKTTSVFSCVFRTYIWFSGTCCRYAEVLVLVMFILLALLWLFREPKFIPGWGSFFESDENGARYFQHRM